MPFIDRKNMSNNKKALTGAGAFVGGAVTTLLFRKMLAARAEAKKDAANLAAEHSISEFGKRKRSYKRRMSKKSKSFGKRKRSYKRSHKKH